MIDKFETRKDTVQVLTESMATHVGRIANILTGAVRDIAHEVGEWTSDVFEMREASARARADDERHRPSPGGTTSADYHDDEYDEADGDATG